MLVFFTVCPVYLVSNMQSEAPAAYTQIYGLCVQVVHTAFWEVSIA